MKRSSRLEDLDITRDELDKIGLALKDEEFRKLFADYIEEITDPENQKLYEKEITQLEKERGMDVAFVHPNPGYVIKTSAAGEKKAFINICYNDLMKVPTCESARRDNACGTDWSIPYSLSEPREDYDKKYKRCLIYDVVFHSTTLTFAARNPRFKKMVNDTACDAVENNFKVQLDKKNLKFPKLKYKGTPKPSVIRKAIPGAKPNPEDVEFYEQIYPSKPQKSKVSQKQSPCEKLQKPDETSYTIPKYCIKHRHGIDFQEFTDSPQAKLLATVPSQLIVEVILPLMKTAATINLDVTAKTISLISETPSKYKLNLTLPYPVKEEEGVAKFDKDLHRLLITLPVQVELYREPLPVLQDESALTEINDNTVDPDVDKPDCHPKQKLASDQECGIVSEENTAVDLIIDGESAEKPKIEEIDDILTSELDNIPLLENDPFFDPNITYSLPTFKSYLAKNTLTFAFDIKNAIPESLCHHEEKNCFYLKCSSVGAGYFTAHYGFCVKMNADVSDVKTDIWNNHVTAEFILDRKAIPLFFEAGVVENDLENFDMPQDKFDSDSSDDSDATDSDDSTKNTVEAVDLDTISNIEHQSEPSADKSNKCVLSEIPRVGSLDATYSSIKLTRGILKSDAAIESIKKSDGFEMHNPINLDKVIINEEITKRPNEDQLQKLKKTVKFKEVVMKNIFRSNSRIVGQKNKNQRKKRNKKRAQELKMAEKELLNKKKQEALDFINENESLKGLPIPGIADNNHESGDYINFKSDLILKLDM